MGKKFYTLVGVLLCLASYSFCQKDVTPPFVLHEKIGDVIETNENERYNFFGDIPGFTAARLMSRGSQNFSFYLLRNSENRAQILVLDLKELSFDGVRIKIASRILAVEQNQLFPDAVFPVDPSRWLEKSLNKKVVLRDGSQLLGTLSQAQEDTVTVQTHSGLSIPVPVGLIADLSEDVSRVTEGNFYRSDPNYTRLFFGPTARKLQAGRGYFADYYIFFPTLAYGLTDFLSLAGGMSIFPAMPLPDQVFYFMPKVTFEVSKNLGVGGGLMFLSFPSDEENENLSLGYGVATFGKQTSAFTAGFGLPLGGTEANSFILLLGGEVQISNSAKLISENWFFLGDESFSLLSAGIRFFGERLAVDLAFLTAPEAFEEGGFPFLPYVDFSVVFGK